MPHLFSYLWGQVFVGESYILIYNMKRIFVALANISFAAKVGDYACDCFSVLLHSQASREYYGAIEIKQVRASVNTKI